MMDCGLSRNRVPFRSSTHLPLRARIGSLTPVKVVGCFSLEYTREATSNSVMPCCPTIALLADALLHSKYTHLGVGRFHFARLLRTRKMGNAVKVTK